MEFFAQFNINLKTNLRFPQASHFKHTVHFTVLQITIHKRTHSYAYLCSQSHTSMPLFSFKMKKNLLPWILKPRHISRCGQHKKLPKYLPVSSIINHQSHAQAHTHPNLSGHLLPSFYTSYLRLWTQPYIHYFLLLSSLFHILLDSYSKLAAKFFSKKKKRRKIPACTDRYKWYIL